MYNFDFYGLGFVIAIAFFPFIVLYGISFLCSKIKEYTQDKNRIEFQGYWTYIQSTGDFESQNHLPYKKRRNYKQYLKYKKKLESNSSDSELCFS